MKNERFDWEVGNDGISNLNYSRYLGDEEISTDTKIKDLSLFQDSIVVHHQLPNFIQSKVDIRFFKYIDILVSNFAHEKVTPENLKILKLAYGLAEDKSDINLNLHSFTPKNFLTEDSALDFIHEDLGFDFENQKPPGLDRDLRRLRGK